MLPTAGGLRSVRRSYVRPGCNVNLLSCWNFIDNHSLLPFLVRGEVLMEDAYEVSPVISSRYQYTLDFHL